MSVDKVGKICTIDDPQVNGAMFDVSEDVAEELLKLPENSEIVIHVLIMLPKIQGEESRGHTNMYGQFPQGSGRPSSIRRGSFANNDRSGSGGFQWMCHTCNEYGHQASYCSKKKQNRNLHCQWHSIFFSKSTHHHKPYTSQVLEILYSH